MAILKIPKKEIEKYSKINEELIEKINLMGIPIESISENEIELEVMPNRPDTLSMQGYLRALKAYLGKEPGLKEYKIKKSGEKIIVNKSVSEIRPYSMAAIVKSVDLTDERIKEIMQWQEKIHATIGRNRKKVALGYYQLDKIKFPVKYTAKKPEEIIFEPLGIPKKMNALQILSKHPCGKEFGDQLKDFEKFPVYYDSNNEVLSLPPIVNSNNLGNIIPSISDILIECSGTNLALLKKTILMAVADLIDIGGKAYSIDVIYENKAESIDFSTEKIKLSLENANKLLGLQLKEKDLEKLLPKMGYNYKNGKVEIPSWRTDILHEVDIIEDIAIAYGYNNLIPKMPKVATIAQESPESKIKTKISEILIGLGLIETSSYHLIKKEETERSDISFPIEVENSKTEYKFLRPNLLIPALRIFSENKDSDYPQKLFEIGTTFSIDKENKTETGIKEIESLIIASSPANFTEMKQLLDYLAKMLNIQYSLKEAINKDMVEGRTAQILLNDKPLGYMGDIHPKILKEWNIEMPVAIIEISLEEIFSFLQSNQQ